MAIRWHGVLPGDETVRGEYLLGRGYLVMGERNRHVIIAIGWGSSSEMPKRFFDRKAAALAWARGLLEPPEV